MRIAYGIHGYARGHASRALGVLPELSDHDLMILAGGDAYDLLSLAGFQVQEIPTFRYTYKEGATTYSKTATLRDNSPLICDLLFSGPSYKELLGILERFEPDLVISDSEPWTQRAANEHGVPLLSFDHYGVYAYCSWDMPLHYRLHKALASNVYKACMGNPDKMIVSSFYPVEPADERVSAVGPIVREEVKRAEPAEGDHLLVYLNSGLNHFAQRLESALIAAGYPVHVYGADKTGTQGNLSFFPVDPVGFVRDLASCRAVVSSAGNQLIGETLWLKKPVMAIPEDSIDQRLNALGIESMQVGTVTTVEGMTAAALERFLQERDTYRNNCEAFARDASNEVAAMVNTYLHGLGGFSAQGGGIF